MPWLAYQLYVGSLAKCIEKGSCRNLVKRELRGKLQQQEREFLAQPLTLIQEAVERFPLRDQFATVTERARHLHRKAKMRRHARGPAGVCLHSVVPVE